MKVNLLKVYSSIKIFALIQCCNLHPLSNPNKTKPFASLYLFFLVFQVSHHLFSRLPKAFFVTSVWSGTETFSTSYFSKDCLNLSNKSFLKHLNAPWFLFAWIPLWLSTSFYIPTFLGFVFLHNNIRISTLSIGFCSFIQTAFPSSPFMTFAIASHSSKEVHAKKTSVFFLIFCTDTIRANLISHLHKFPQLLKHLILTPIVCIIYYDVLI